MRFLSLLAIFCALAFSAPHLARAQTGDIRAMPPLPPVLSEAEKERRRADIFKREQALLPDMHDLPGIALQMRGIPGGNRTFPAAHEKIAIFADLKNVRGIGELTGNAVCRAKVLLEQRQQAGIR
jgi:hypothetical protein